MNSFVAATTWPSMNPGVFQAQFYADWYQGRGAFGGVVAAGVLRGIMSSVDPRRKPRTFHLQLCAPAQEGGGTLEVVVEREGAWVSQLSARLFQGENDKKRVVAFAAATLAAPRPSASSAAFLRPPPRKMEVDPRSIDPMPTDFPFLPVFTSYVDYRPCIGAFPYTGAEKAELGGYVRIHDPTPLDAPYAAALLDAYPPAIFPRLDAPQGGASVDITYDFFSDFPDPNLQEKYFFVHATASVCDGGFADQKDELFDDEGNLLARCRQLMALL